MASLHIAGLRKTFGTTQVLKGISLDIAEGEFVALLGPSGCGKTTLLRTVAGLEAQDSGSIHIAGRQVDELGPAERDVALVFQSYALYPHLTVGQNIALPLTMRRLTAVERLAGMSRLWPSVRTRRATIDADVAAIARSMEIDHLLERKPAQLSGGQKQRVAVARALVRKPSLLLMDEPLSNLDAKLRVQMRREIVDMHRRHHATTVYVTHDQTEAMTMADRIAVIFDGELQQIDTPAAVYRSPATLAVAEFVGSPKINIVPCTPVEGGIECLGRHLAGATAGSGHAGFVGLRAEHLSLRPRGAGAIDCRVLNLEYLGADVLVIVALGRDEQLCLRMDAQAFEALGAHDALAVGLHTPQLLVFDTNGQRLRWSPTPAA